MQWCPSHLLSFGYSQQFLGLSHFGDVVLISRLVSFFSPYCLTWPCSSEVQQLLSASSCPHSCSARRVLSVHLKAQPHCLSLTFPLSYLTPLHEGFLSSQLLLFHLRRFAIFHSHCLHIFLYLQQLSSAFPCLFPFPSFIIGIYFSHKSNIQRSQFYMKILTC